MAEVRAPPTVTIEHLHGVTRVRVAGTIDERFKRDSFAALAGRTDPVVFDLDPVTRITSFGVREWMGALKDLPSDQYYFIHCRPAVFTQFNIVNGFGGKGHVVSFYCPYVCENCDNAFDALVDMRSQRDVVAARSAPKTLCPNCKAPAEFDDTEATYFGRASTWQLPALAPEVEAAIDGNIAPQSLKLEKTVDGDLTVLWLSGPLDRAARLKRHLDGLEGTVLIILGAVVTATSESFAALAETLAETSADVYLARVPVGVLRVLAASPQLLSRAKLVSVLARTACTRCGQAYEHDLVRWAHGNQPSAQCPKCGANTIPPPSDADRAAMKALRFAAPPPEMHSYLGSDAPPKPFGDSSSGESGAHKRADGGTANIPAGTRIGKYEVVKRLGMGGMAEVLLGKQLGLEGFEKRVVIKRILPHLAAEEHFVQMFLHEARVAARLLHPNVVQVYDLIRENDDYYTIMEYVQGTDLNQLLRNAARLDVTVPIEICCRIIADMCGGLVAAHTYTDEHGKPAPILHRDVSPHNVLISRDGISKLADFGVAKAADSIHNTATGHLKGKVIYMAPELLVGGTPDARIDIYAAGLVLFVALTQSHPFFRGSELVSMKAVLEESVPPVESLRKDTPPALAAIVARATQKDPAQRYPSAAELQTALEKFLASYGQPSGTNALTQWLRDFLARVEATPKGTKTHVTMSFSPTDVTTPGKGAKVAPAEDDQKTTPGRPLFDDDDA